MMRLGSQISSRDFFAAVALVGAMALFPQSASAQSAFCPPTVPNAPPGVNTTGYQQMSGNCTNGRAGAFSGAALASQAIGDLAGSSTGLETSAAEQAIEEREKAEAACPPDQVLVDGICKARPPVSAPAVIAAPPPTVPAPPPVSVAAPATAAPPASAAPAPAAQKHPAKAKVAGRPPSGALPTKKPVYEGPPVYDQSFRIGSWAQGFGDYDHRSGSQTISFSCCLALRNSPPTTPVTLEANSTTSSGGFIGGIDFTKRGLTGPQDGLIAGVLGGYIWNNITINNSILPLFPSSVGNGSSRTTATINGPSVGLYATYFNGPFS